MSGEDKPFSFLSVDKERIIELYSASKTFGMTGARLGFVAGSKTIINMVKNIVIKRTQVNLFHYN